MMGRDFGPGTLTGTGGSHRDRDGGRLGSEYRDCTTSRGVQVPG